MVNCQGKDAGHSARRLPGRFSALAHTTWSLFQKWQSSCLRGTTPTDDSRPTEVDKRAATRSSLRARAIGLPMALILATAGILVPSRANAVTVTMSYNAGLSGPGLIVLTDPSGTFRIDITVGGGAISIVGNEVRTQFFDAVSQPRMDMNANFLMSEVFFGNMDDIDDNSSRDSFAANVPGTWGNLSNTSNPGADLDQFPLSAPPPGRSFAELIARGALSPVLLNDDEAPIQNDFTASFFPTTPTNSFSILVDDTEGGNNILSRYFFGEIEVEIDPEIKATKTQTSTGTSVGDTITYTIAVENTGDFPVESISVNDTLEQLDGTPLALTSGPTFVSNSLGSPEGSLDIDEVGTYTATYVLTQDDIDAGGVCNSAEFSGISAGDPVGDVSDNGNDADGNTEDDCTAFSIVQTPVWTLGKSSASTITEAGQIASYTFSLANTGNVSISTVSLTDAQCDAAPTLDAGDTDSDSVLDAGETWTYSCDHTVTQAEVDAGSVDNSASATGTPAGGTLDPAEDDNTIPVAADPALDLVKTADPVAPAEYVVGAVVDYTYLVTNTGNVTITAPVTITDNLIPASDITCPAFPAAGIAPDGTYECQGTYTVTASDIEAGSVTNIASASDGTTTSNTDDETVPSGADPQLTLTKTANDTTYAAVGDVLDYTFAVENTGTAAYVQPVTIEDDRIGTIACWSPSAADPDFTAGETITCSADYKVTQVDLDAGSVTNIAYAETLFQGSVPVGSPTDEVTIDATQTSLLSLVKSDPVNADEDGTDSITVGDTLTYTVTATNTGTITQTNVLVTDEIVIPSQVTCASVAPGETCVLTGSYTIGQDNVDAGEIVNTASATSDNLPDPVRDTVTTPVEQSNELGIVKSDPVNTDEDGTDSITIGDTLAYQITATNTGATTQTNVVVTDALLTPSEITCDSLAPGATCVLNGTLTVDVSQVQAGEIVNTASVVSDNVTNPVETSVTTPVQNESAIEVAKSDPVNADEDGSGSVTLGDTVTYTVTATNTGWGVETAMTVVDAMLTPDTATCAQVLPGETCVLTGIYTVAQGDVDAGEIVNTASATTDALTDPVRDTVTTPVEQSPMLEVQKIVTENRKLFPLVSDVTFRITLENVGTTTLTGVQLEDDIASAMTPATIIGMPFVEVSGLAGDNSANPAFDGATVLETLGGAGTLTVGQTATVDITVQLDFTDGYPGTPNTAYGNAVELDTPVPSDFPVETPDDPTDNNPTPVTIIDTDGDGATDGLESATEDRDGDGTPDSEDYDPTGYFYCEDDGSILTGGLISVTGPAGTQTGEGSSNNITILRDGSDGVFQFFVSAPGTYRLVPTYLEGTLQSTNHTASAGALNLTGFLPADPAVLGSGEFGATGVLSDFSAAANPFYLEFDIEAGDPSLFNNNLPLMFCGTPEVTASKEVAGEPALQLDGSNRLTFRVAAENTGSARVEDVRIVDDLSAAFPDATLTVVSTEIEAAPTGFWGTRNTGFDGIADRELLSSGGALDPGQSVSMLMTLDVFTETGGTFENTVQAGGSTPGGAFGVGGDPIPWSEAVASTTLIAAPRLEDLIVTKVADRQNLRIGEAVRYTLTVTNPADRIRNGIDIVDRLPPGFVYMPDTATYNGVADEPAMAGRELIWRNRSLAPDETVALTLVSRSGAATVGAETFVNHAFATDALTGTTISNVATATVAYLPEPVFDCGEVIGKVFDDRNRNGYQDEGEPGIPGVRLATVRGLLITSDEYGRYHVTCADIPDADIGSNFLLKIDERTLPTGYRITTENPRVVRLTRGKITKLDFGAAITRVISLNLTDGAFEAGTYELRTESHRAVDQLITVLGQGPSVLRLTYYGQGEDYAVVQERLRQASAAIRKRWQQRDGRYRLEIEQRAMEATR